MLTGGTKSVQSSRVCACVRETLTGGEFAHLAIVDIPTLRRARRVQLDCSWCTAHPLPNIAVTALGRIFIRTYMYMYMLYTYMHIHASLFVGAVAVEWGIHVSERVRRPPYSRTYKRQYLSAMQNSYIDVICICICSLECFSRQFTHM